MVIPISPPGDVVELFGVGFGPTNPPVAAGQPFTGAAPTVSPVTVTIGGIQAKVLFSGISAAGLYQINLVIPDGLASGDQPLQASVGGSQTVSGPVVTIR